MKPPRASIRRRTVLPALLTAALALAGCGGETQDADEPEANYELEIVDASFASSQQVARQHEMAIEVRNAGEEQVPNVALTVRGFTAERQRAGLADASRPIWIVDSEPRGGFTAHTNTWALGPLPAGESRTFRWRLTAVQPGRHDITYRAEAGLHGKARARLAETEDEAVAGSFEVNVSREPAQTRIGDDGESVEELEEPER
jgi:hypothetical protein